MESDDEEYYDEVLGFEQSLFEGPPVRHTFVYRNLNAKSVCISGSFVNWKLEIPMERVEGEFRREIDLPQGRHEYKFIVDGEWVCDEEAETIMTNKQYRNNTIDIIDIMHPDRLEMPEVVRRKRETQHEAAFTAYGSGMDFPLVDATPSNSPHTTPGREGLYKPVAIGEDKNFLERFLCSMDDIGEVSTTFNKKLGLFTAPALGFYAGEYTLGNPLVIIKSEKVRLGTYLKTSKQMPDRILRFLEEKGVQEFDFYFELTDMGGMCREYGDRVNVLFHAWKYPGSIPPFPDRFEWKSQMDVGAFLTLPYRECGVSHVDGWEEGSLDFDASGTFDVIVHSTEFENGKIADTPSLSPDRPRLRSLDADASMSFFWTVGVERHTARAVVTLHWVLHQHSDGNIAMIVRSAVRDSMTTENLICQLDFDLKKWYKDAVQELCRIFLV